jgi:hypothetical protein
MNKATRNKKGVVMNKTATKKTTKESKLERMESEKLEELFESSFRNHIEKHRNISVDEFECMAERTSFSEKPKIKVTIFGMAGTTSLAEYYDKKSKKVISGGKKIPLMNENTKICDFVFDNAMILNTNDYVVYYVEE